MSRRGGLLIIAAAAAHGAAFAIAGRLLERRLTPPMGPPPDAPLLQRLASIEQGITAIERLLRENAGVRPAGAPGIAEAVPRPQPAVPLNLEALRNTLPAASKAIAPVMLPPPLATEIPTRSDPAIAENR